MIPITTENHSSRFPLVNYLFILTAWRGSPILVDFLQESAGYGFFAGKGSRLPDGYGIKS